MIKKLLKFAVSMAAINWIAKKVSPQQKKKKRKQMEPAQRNLNAK